MPDRVDARPVLAIVGAMALLVALFVDWYEPGGTAWQLFEVWDVVLAALALAVIYLSVEEIFRRVAFPERWFLALAGAAFLIVLSQLLSAPPAAAEASRETGVWLALGGAVLMVAAGLLAIAHVSVSVVAGGRDEGTVVDQPEEQGTIPPTEPADSPREGSG